MIGEESENSRSRHYFMMLF